MRVRAGVPFLRSFPGKPAALALAMFAASTHALAGSVCDGDRTAVLGAGGDLGSTAAGSTAFACGYSNSADGANSTAMGVYTDAANVNQLNAAVGAAVGASNAYTDQPVGILRKEAFQGIAAAAAMAPPAPSKVGGTSLAVGEATYRGESALGMALSHQYSETVNLNAGVGVTGGKSLGRVGVGFNG